MTAGPAAAGDLYLAGIATWLPPRVPVEEFVRRGACDSETAARSEMISVAVDENDHVPAEMAVRAARLALRRAGCAPGDIALVLHAYLYDQGNELWSPAAYVQRRSVSGTAPAIGIQQVSNGGLAALDVASAYLRAGSAGPAGGVGSAGAAGSAGSAALITTADRFAAPGYDRWYSDPGTVYADGGTAVVLSRLGGFARVLAVALVSGPELEGMHRAGPAYGVGLQSSHRHPVDLGAHKRKFVDEAGLSGTMAAIAAGQREALEAALSAADTKLEEIDWFLLPHFGLRRLTSNYLRHLGVEAERTSWSFGRTVGHLGAGDHIAALEYLVTTGRIRAGQRCALLAVGAGFTWSCAVLHILSEPDWAAVR